MGFDSADDLFCSISMVDVGGHQLEFCIPGFGDGIFECGADFIVHDLDVDIVVVVGEALHDGAIGHNAVFVNFTLEWGTKDDIAVTMVGDHGVLVAAACTDGEVASVVCVEFVDWVNADVEFV